MKPKTNPFREKAEAARDEEQKPKRLTREEFLALSEEQQKEHVDRIRIEVAERRAVAVETGQQILDEAERPRPLFPTRKRRPGDYK